MDKLLKELKTYNNAKQQAIEKGFDCMITNIDEEGKKEYIFCFSSNVHSLLKKYVNVDTFSFINKDGTEIEFTRSV